MRDKHGKYRNLKEILDNGPEWATGCIKCKCGVVSSAPLTLWPTVSMERMVQMIDKQIVFCDCQAGVAYQANLFVKYHALCEEARRHPMMLDAAAKGTHPDIENTRSLMGQAMLKKAAPTIHP